MRTKIEQETAERLIPDAASRPAERPVEEATWARRQARRASFRILLPFLIAVALGVVHRVDGVLGATRDLRDLAARTVPSEGGGPPETISHLAHRLAEEVYGDKHDEEVAARYESLVRVVAKEMDRLGGKLDS